MLSKGIHLQVILCTAEYLIWEILSHTTPNTFSNRLILTQSRASFTLSYNISKSRTNYNTMKDTMQNISKKFRYNVEYFNKKNEKYKNMKQMNLWKKLKEKKTSSSTQTQLYMKSAFAFAPNPFEYSRLKQHQPNRISISHLRFMSKICGKILQNCGDVKKNCQ